MTQHNAVHGIITLCMQRSKDEEEQLQKILPKKQRRGWAGWRPLNEESKTDLFKKLAGNGDAKTSLSLQESQKQMADAVQTSLQERNKEGKRFAKQGEAVKEREPCATDRLRGKSYEHKAAQSLARHAVKCCWCQRK